MPDITSRQHAFVKAFRSAARGQSENVLLDGWHLLHEAVDAGVEIDTVALVGAPPTRRDNDVVERIARTTNVVTVTSAVMDALSPVRTPVGVVALARRTVHAVEALLNPAPALLVVAADIQDPGNAGAIVRSAEAGGSTGVAFVGRSVDPWTWKALRAGMGSTFRLPTFRDRHAEPLLEQLRVSGVSLIATVPHAQISMYAADFRKPVAIMLGSEGAGLSDLLLAAAGEHLSIPMRAPVESLNVAVAAALLVYEARRQREV